MIPLRDDNPTSTRPVLTMRCSLPMSWSFSIRFHSARKPAKSSSINTGDSSCGDGHAISTGGSGCDSTDLLRVHEHVLHGGLLHIAGTCSTCGFSATMSKMPWGIFATSFFICSAGWPHRSVTFSQIPHPPSLPSGQRSHFRRSRGILLLYPTPGCSYSSRSASSAGCSTFRPGSFWILVVLQIVSGSLTGTQQAAESPGGTYRGFCAGLALVGTVQKRSVRFSILLTTDPRSSTEYSVRPAILRTSRSVQMNVTNPIVGDDISAGDAERRQSGSRQLVRGYSASPASPFRFALTMQKQEDPAAFPAPGSPGTHPELPTGFPAIPHRLLIYSDRYSFYPCWRPFPPDCPLTTLGGQDPHSTLRFSSLPMRVSLSAAGIFSRIQKGDNAAQRYPCCPQVCTTASPFAGSKSGVGLIPIGGGITCDLHDVSLDGQRPFATSSAAFASGVRAELPNLK